MAGGKVSVRQKMINMMYLVLTALLALNVSKDILHAFHLVELSMNKSGINIDQKNKDILAAFAADNQKRPEKVGPYYKKAQDAEKIASEFIKYVEDLKKVVETGAGGRKENNPEGELTMNDNIEMHANLLINEGKGTELKNKINETRDKLLALLDKDDQKRIKSDLQAQDNPALAPQTWESELFEHSPAAAVVTLLQKIQNDAKNTEAQVLETLAKAIDKSSQTFDQVVAKIIPKSGFVISGGKFEADILLVAYDSKQTSDVVINGNRIKPEGGVAKYEVTTGGEGTQTVKGYIDFQGKDGAQQLAFETQYTVFKGAATISAEKMNVLYIGLDNPITIAVPGFAPERVSASMSSGNLKKISSNQFHAIVNTRGEVTINVTVKMDDGSTRPMGSQKFRVRKIPTPLAQLGTLQNGATETVGTIKAMATRVYGSLGEGFAYEDIKYTVNSYIFILVPKRGEMKQVVASNAVLPPGATALVNSIKSGDRIIIDQIKASGPDGVRNLTPVVITAR
jgi:gliding motility-associated protein GldM